MLYLHTDGELKEMLSSPLTVPDEAILLLFKPKSWITNESIILYLTVSPLFNFPHISQFIPIFSNSQQEELGSSGEEGGRARKTWEVGEE